MIARTGCVVMAEPRIGDPADVARTVADGVGRRPRCWWTHRSVSHGAGELEQYVDLIGSDGSELNGVDSIVQWERDWIRWLNKNKIIWCRDWCEYAC